MITAGIDVGTKTIKVVVVRDGQMLSQKSDLAGLETGISLNRVFDAALEAAGGMNRTEIGFVLGTGIGRREIPFADGHVSEVSAASRGAVAIHPLTRTVVDVGAEEARVARCNNSGRVVDFAVNDKCAAGAGVFSEAIARALEVDLEEFGRMSLLSERAAPMNAQCTVFAESEVVSLLHANIPKEDIARAVHDAMASRVASLVRRTGLEHDIVIAGGLARNPGFVDSMKRSLEADIFVPDEPEFVGAFGAALSAAERALHV
jgi:benzoyl-CoA reductase subunit D